MTDSTSVVDESKIAELEKLVAVYKRKIEREKLSRQAAEQQLEQYSREIYQANQALKQSLISSEKRQSELSYLSQASAQVVSEQSLQTLLQSNVALTGKFFKAICGTVVICQGRQAVNCEQSLVWSPEQEWQSSKTLFDYFIGQLPLQESEPLDSWIVCEIEPTPRGVEGANWLVYLKLDMYSEQTAWIAFLSSAEMLEEEALYVLETARGHLLSGVRRRINDIRIGKRNKQLQETVTSLEQARKQLIQSEKMASLGQMAAGVAHEINNPIGFIRSNSEILKEYLQDYSKLTQALQTHLETQGGLDQKTFEQICQQFDLAFLQQDSEELIDSNIDGTDRVKDIVDSLKTFSHGADSEYTPISIEECIEAALKVAWNSLKYEHQLVNNLCKGLPKVLGNPGQLQQVFVNLFVNAAQAMEGGGTLTIECEIVEEKIILKISDTGCGMDEKTLKQLFTPFFTTKPVGVGTGLGLSVSYAILESHNVAIDVASQVGEGTCFTLSFPILNLD